MAKLTFFLIFFVFLSLNAQEKPDWTYEKPIGIKYNYYVGVGAGNSIQSAFVNAFNEALKTIAKEDKVFIYDDSILKKLSNIVSKNQEIIVNDFKQNTVDELRTVTSKVIIGARFVDFFYDSKKSTCWILIAKAKFGNSDNKNYLSYSSKAPIIWRSVLVPGWGQYYKNKKGRGRAIFALEALSVGAFVYTNQMWKNNVRKSKETLDINIIKAYRKRADNWKIKRNISIGGVLAVYVFNLIDASSGKGKIKYAYHAHKIELVAYNDGHYNQFGFKINF